MYSKILFVIEKGGNNFVKYFMAAMCLEGEKQPDLTTKDFEGNDLKHFPNFPTDMEITDICRVENC